MVRETTKKKPRKNLTSLCSLFFVIGGNWPELLNFLVQWTQSPNEIYREAALDIFSQLLSHLDKDLDSFFDTLKGILIKGLQDPVCKVRLAALNGTVHFLVYRSRTRSEFQPFLPHMFEVCFLALLLLVYI